MLSLVSSLALLASAQAVAPEPSETGASLWEIGDSIATMRVCNAFGYTLDQQGLADWAMARRDVAAKDKQTLTAAEAQSEIEQAANSHTARIYAIYWEGSLGGGPRADEIVDKQYRFVKLYRKKCDALALSPELGAFLTPPVDRRAPSQVIASIKQGFQRAKVVR